jgi:hypothetical protein
MYKHLENTPTISLMMTTIEKVDIRKILPFIHET